MMIVVVVTVVFFVGRTFYLLSQQSSSMSEKNTQSTIVNHDNVAGSSIRSDDDSTFWPACAYGNFNNIIFCFRCFLHTTILILITPSYREALMWWQKTQTKSP
ncbi:hypothetical protein PRIPAC_81833, partial [Pristionchus pacificus]|uniref:Uncharacterized protein n=1 Tax=Pristionchus pacificus TaxID=54126 RepID=A0A2A6CNN1_PRIPA